MSNYTSSCHLCKKSFSSIQALSSHFGAMHSNTRETKLDALNFANREVCCVTCRKETTFSVFSKHLSSHSPMPMPSCAECGNVVSNRRNRFCGNACSAMFNNRERRKTNFIPNPTGINGVTQNKEANLHKCQTCDKQITASRKFCQECHIAYRKCQLTNYWQSLPEEERKQKQCETGKKSAAMRVMRSKDEISLFNLCSTILSVDHNVIISDGWDADIAIPDMKIAIFWDGPWHYKQMPFSGHSLSQVQTRDRIKTELFKSLGWTVFSFRDDHFTPESAFIFLCEELQINS